MIIILKPIIEGIIGSVGFLMFKIWTKEDMDFNYKRIIARIVLGAIVGYLWYISNMPNSFNTVMAGMLSPEILNGFINKFKIDKKV